jgi:ubiquinone/menaquinone biosynthesis C-methylase UbiE
LIKSYAEKLPFLNNEFDVVFCSNALDHTEKPDMALKEIFRVLKDQGKLILTCEIFNEGCERDIAHPHSFTATKLIYLLRDFKIIFLKTSPWIGMTSYILGNREYKNMEWVIVAQKENKKI